MPFWVSGGRQLRSLKTCTLEHIHHLITVKYYVTPRENNAFIMSWVKLWNKNTNLVKVR